MHVPTNLARRSQWLVPRYQSLYHTDFSRSSTSTDRHRCLPISSSVTLISDAWKETWSLREKRYYSSSSSHSASSSKSSNDSEDSDSVDPVRHSVGKRKTAF